jgi:hypothetical protein
MLDGRPAGAGRVCSREVEVYLLPIMSYICNTFVIGVSTEITTKLPSRDLQDTVHIVYFYVA